MYLINVFADLQKRYSDQPEFLQAVEEFLTSIDLLVDKDPRIQQDAIIERIVEPERMIKFRVSWVDDSGKVQVNRAMRVQFNSAIGPYKGGIRFHHSVNESIMKFLAFEQTFKNSLTCLPMGGAKGGSDFDPEGKSDNEIMRFCQGFILEMYRHIGPRMDVPAGDLGVGAREIGYMYGMYKRIENEFSGTFTSKGIESGGSLGRAEATGYGLCYFVEEMLRVFKNTTFKNKRVIISGAGKVGSMAAEKAIELGANVIAISDVSGVIYDEKGIDIHLIKKLSKTNTVVIDKYITYHPEATYYPDPKDIWKIPCDIALPCATQNEIYLDSAEELVKNGCWLVAEGANMPTTIDATKYFREHNVLFAPGKAANAGGVAVSGLEMSQNATFQNWSFKEVDDKLHEIMKRIFNSCHEASLTYTGKPDDLITGANIAGFMKVYKAMLQQGV
ncbi:MAG: NADP-specific glutamate dehydrogenase [Acholeplasma sp.]|jgi:glutamate dehydrogenase (NADP+)|nr:MAG: NADP-specific glutamate dehydrogenase [Acholeplasma sp.]